MIYDVSLIAGEDANSKEFNALIKALYRHAADEDLQLDEAQQLLKKLADYKIKINTETVGSTRLDLTEYEKDYGLPLSCVKALNVAKEAELISDVFIKDAEYKPLSTVSLCFKRNEFNYSAKLTIEAEASKSRELCGLNFTVNYFFIDKGVKENLSFGELSQAQQKSDLARQAYILVKEKGLLERIPLALTSADLQLAIRTAAAAYKKYTERHRPRFAMYRRHGSHGQQRVDTLLEAIGAATEMSDIKVALVNCFKKGWRVNPGARDHSFVSFLMNELQRFDLKSSLGLENVDQGANFTHTMPSSLVENRTAFIKSIQTLTSVAPAGNASPSASQGGYVSLPVNSLYANGQQPSLHNV